MSTATEYATGLRDLADWIEAHPDHADDFYRIEAVAYPDDDAKIVRDWARAMKPCEKDYRGTSGLFTLSRNFGPVKLEATFNRSAVCEKVVTMREVTKLVPDPSFEVPMVEEVTMEESVEWVCGSILEEVTA